MKVGIINHGMGNILSVINAVEYLGYSCGLINDAHDFSYYDKLILPGVGAFQDCMINLKTKKLIMSMNSEVLDKKKPILGICLGMQVMAKIGYEGGEFLGIGWIDAEVVKINPIAKDFKIPQIGWNRVDFLKDNFLFKNVPPGSAFYFVHSYFMKCSHSSEIIATCSYGHEITAAVKKENIVATQFHPEKSQEIGLRVLENFIKWKY